MASTIKKKPTGYDKYVDWKLFSIPVVLFFLLIILPASSGMRDVGTEYSLGTQYVVAYITQKLFNKTAENAEQWQLLAARMMEQSMKMGAMSKARFLQRDNKWCRQYKIPVDAQNLVRVMDYIEHQVSNEDFEKMMQEALDLRRNKLSYESLAGSDKKAADKGTWHIQVAIAMMVFVVFCFLTECIPLPGVAFCIGLILVFCGVVSRQQVAMLYWDDACWFIMGSLMFAAAFVKTGVDKRVCLAIFKKLAVPNVRWITPSVA